MVSDAWIVTTDPDNPGESFEIFDRSIMNQFAIKNRSLNSLTKEKEENKQWDGFKTPTYPLEKLAQLLEYNTWHKKCCDAISTDAMGTEWTIVKKNNSTKDDETQKQRLTEFIEGLTTNIHQIFKEITYDRRSIGCAALEIIRDPNDPEHKPIDLHPLTVTDLHRHNDNCRIKQQVGTREAWFIEYGTNFNEKGEKFDVNCNTGIKVPFGSLPYEQTANEVIWFREYAPQSKTYGLANIVPALNAIYGDLGRAEYNTKFFENYGLPAFAITVTGDFQDYDVPEYFEDGTPNPEYDVKQTLRYKISKQIKEVIKNPHSAVTITVPSLGEDSNVDVNIQPLSVDQKDSSFVVYRSDNREEVAAANGVPLYRLGLAINGSLSGNVASETSNIYSDGVIQPLRTENANIINTLALNEFEITDYIFSLDSYRKKDEQKEIQNGTTLFEHGALTLGEYINYFGKKYGATVPENSFLMNCRCIGNTLIDENGTPVSQQGGANPNFLGNLEEELVYESEEIEDENNPDNAQTGKNNTSSIEDTSKKSNTHTITRTIQRAFNNRK